MRRDENVKGIVRVISNVTLDAKMEIPDSQRYP